MIIDCEGIKKTFYSGGQAVYALRDIDLKIEKNETLILKGPSGSGKTTFLSVIAGILRFDEGKCIILGHNYAEMTEEERTVFRGKNIGFVFQSFNLIPHITILENVLIPLIIQGVDEKTAKQRGIEILSKLGLGDRINGLPTELSGGQKQRVSIARGCITNPAIILCDEPTSALDEKTGHSVMELLKQMQLENNMTLIVVTHDSRILPFADQVLSLEDGRIIKQ